MFIHPVTPLPLQLAPSTVRGWFDFSDTSAENITQAANKASFILNKTGINNHLRQATSSNQPTTGTRTHNGLNVLDFDYTTASQFLTFDSNIAVSEPFTIFVVGKFDNEVTADGQALIGRQTAAIAGQMVIRKEASAVFNSFLFGSGGASSSRSATGNANANIHCITFQNGGGIRYWLNNTFIGEGANVSGYDNSVTTLLVIGCSNGSGAKPLDGWVGEIAIYNEVFDANRIGAFSSYAGRKWGITVA